MLRSGSRPRRIGVYAHLSIALLSGSFLWGGIPGRVGADPIWKTVLTGRRVEADENTDYRITEQSGPWLIMAATFSGDGAEEQARELTLELRRRYKLHAYLHEMAFDYSKGTVGRGVNQMGKPLRMRYQRGQTLREIAVMVGDFPNVDDHLAQKTLKKIKSLRPHSLSVEHRENTNQSLAALRTIQVALLPEGHEAKKRGPMGKAFVTRNPLLPREYFVSQGLDKVVVEMNKNVEHSLLDCKAQFTVKVATFTGTVILDQDKVRKFQKSKKFPSRLAEAADKAHRLTMALRKKGYDAYEFHDRYVSMVTVGAFNSVGLPREDGKIEINPRIHKIMQTFGATPVDAGPGQGTAGFKPKSLNGIPFDLQPQPVHAPKRSAGSLVRRQ